MSIPTLAESTSDSRPPARSFAEAGEFVIDLCARLKQTREATARQRLLDDLCATYDGIADRAGSEDGSCPSTRSELCSRRRHESIEDLLFQLSCTPVISRLFDAKLDVLRDEIALHLQQLQAQAPRVQSVTSRKRKNLLIADAMPSVMGQAA